jgi:hypothetical protein
MPNRLTFLARATLMMSALGVFASAHSATVPVNNPGFEEPAQAVGGWADSATHWSVSQAGVYNPPEGVLTPLGQVAWANGSKASPAILSQGLSAQVAASTRYTLTVDVGWRSDVASSNPTFPGFSVELLAGASVLASAAGTEAPTPGQFSPFTLVYDVLTDNLLIGEALGIRLVSYGPQVNFDNVALDASPVPVPAPLVLLGSALGLATTLFGRRRQKAA